MTTAITNRKISRKVGCYCPRGRRAHQLLTNLGLEVWEKPEEFPYFAFDPVTYVVGVDGDIPQIRPCDALAAICDRNECASIAGLPADMAVWLIEGGQIIWRTTIGDLSLFFRLIQENQPFTRDDEVFSLIAAFERLGRMKELRYSILDRLKQFGFNTPTVRRLQRSNLGGYHAGIIRVLETLPAPTEWIPSPFGSWRHQGFSVL